MTIRFSQGHYDLLPTFEMETDDELMARSLTTHNEIRIKQRIYELQGAYMEIHLTGDSEDNAKTRLMAFLKGKLEVLQELLEDSKEAKVTQNQL